MSDKCKTDECSTTKSCDNEQSSDKPKTNKSCDC